MKSLGAGATYRVLYLQGSLNPGGSKRSLLDITEALRGTPYEPVVACPGRGWLTNQLDERQVPFVVVPFLAWRKWLQRPRVATSIRRQWLPALASWPIALVHSNEFWWAPHAVGLARHLGVPAIVHLRDGHHTLQKARQYRLSDATGMLAVATELRQQFAADAKLLSKTHVLFNAHDALRVQFTGDRAKARAQFQLRPDEIAIGNAGQLCERKNQRLLLRTLGTLRAQQRVPPFKLLLAGEADPAYAAKLRQEMRRWGLDQQILWLGAVQNMAAFYAALDLMVHCATREGLARVIPEAMLARCAIVATAAEGVRDAIPDEQHGAVVARDDEKALANEIERLAKAPELRERLAGQAYARARALFSVEAHRENLLRRYGEWISQKDAALRPRRSLPTN
jgi:glycosyltransferase involved in cell wall biosynthesis